MEKFWRADETLKGQVIDAFRGTGARAIIAENTENQTPGGGWRRVGTSSYYVLYFENMPAP